MIRFICFPPRTHGTIRKYSYGSTAQFGKSIRPKILPHTKVIKGREYCMYFPLL